ncbi:MAG: ArsR/SmtB family transcription factor [Allosphingosinicella sp.]
MTNALAFAALGEPMRQAIVERLAKRPMAVGELAAHLPVTRPAVSQHLKILKEAGLVSDHAEGTRRIYRIDPAGLGAIRAWLDSFWDKALGAYAEAAEREESDELRGPANHTSTDPQVASGEGRPAKGVRHVRPGHGWMVA